MSLLHQVKRVIMGLDKFQKTPCGFCFVEYVTGQLFCLCMYRQLPQVLHRGGYRGLCPLPQRHAVGRSSNQVAQFRLKKKTRYEMTRRRRRHSAGWTGTPASLRDASTDGAGAAGRRASSHTRIRSHPSPATALPSSVARRARPPQPSVAPPRRGRCATSIAWTTTTAAAGWAASTRSPARWTSVRPADKRLRRARAQTAHTARADPRAPSPFPLLFSVRTSARP